ncbi:MAG: polymer-forming cytoskeletal protein [Parcubacteria group bacterium]|nr:polymer-forming cytoskeletal protein [Parcubacteria group bacterium]
MFHKRVFDNKSTQTVFGPSVILEGDIITSEDIIIEGRIFGMINAKTRVWIGETGSVVGKIVCISAFISGQLKGSIVTKQVIELTPTAKIYGDITANQLKIAYGAIIQGRCHVDNIPEEEIQVQEEIKKE